MTKKKHFCCLIEFLGYCYVGKSIIMFLFLSFCSWWHWQIHYMHFHFYQLIAFLKIFFMSFPFPLLHRLVEFYVVCILYNGLWTNVFEKYYNFLSNIFKNKLVYRISLGEFVIWWQISYMNFVRQLAQSLPGIHVHIWHRIFGL